MYVVPCANPYFSTSLLLLYILLHLFPKLERLACVSTCLLAKLVGCIPDSRRICFAASGACLCGGISFPLASLLCYRSMCLIQSTSIISLGTLTCCMSQKTTCISILSRLFLRGNAPPYCPNIPPYQCFRGCCTPHKSHGMQS